MTTITSLLKSSLRRFRRCQKANFRGGCFPLWRAQSCLRSDVFSTAGSERLTGEDDARQDDLTNLSVFWWSRTHRVRAIRHTGYQFVQLGHGVMSLFEDNTKRRSLRKTKSFESVHFKRYFVAACTSFVFVFLAAA